MIAEELAKIDGVLIASLKLDGKSFVQILLEIVREENLKLKEQSIKVLAKVIETP